jgi:hypothetical protein
MNKNKPRCKICELILKPGHLCKNNCSSCKIQLKGKRKSTIQYCKNCIKLNIKCSVCGLLFKSGWALTGHGGQWGGAVQFEFYRYSML